MSLKSSERLNCLTRLVYTLYLAAAENVETTRSESATTVTVNYQTTAADSELTAVTDEVTDSQTQTQTGINAFYCVVSK